MRERGDARREMLRVLLRYADHSVVILRPALLPNADFALAIDVCGDGLATLKDDGRVIVQSNTSSAIGRALHLDRDGARDAMPVMEPRFGSDSVALDRESAFPQQGGLPAQRRGVDASGFR